MSRNNVLLFLFYCVAAVHLGNVQARLKTESIVGGDDAELGKYSYQVSLEIYGKSMCGGGIIGEEYVVTAAHCVINEKGQFFNYPMKVVAGINELKSKISTRVAVDVKKVYVPTEYDPTNHLKRSTGDIAILKLNKPLGISSNSNLGKLKLAEKKTYANEKAIITGFGWNWVDLDKDPLTGVTIETGGGSYGKMRVAETKILSTATCAKPYHGTISEKHICAQVIQRSFTKTEGVCSGDSGGPLVHHGDTLIGVVSTSPIGCKENVAAGVYTRVSSYLDFIQNAIKGISRSDMRSTTLTIR